MKTTDVLVILILISKALLGVKAGQCRFRFSPYSEGYCLTSSACPGAVLSSLCPGQRKNIGCCVLENFPDYGIIKSNITLKMFTEIFNRTDRSESQYEHFVHSLKTAGASSCHQQSAYITQIAYDTNFLSSMEQIPKNLPEMLKEDMKYLGRGAIHVPGKNFYRWLRGKTGNNVIDMPESLAFPTKAFWSAALIWNHSYSIVNDGTLNHVTYNELADGSKYGFLLTNYFLKGLSNDADSLMSVWKRVNQVLKCPCVQSHGPRCHTRGRQGRCKFVADCKGKQVGNLQHCKGPLNAVRCSFDFAAPIEMDVFVSGESLLKKKLLSTFKKICNRIELNSESNVTVKSLKIRTEEGNVSVNRSNERSRKVIVNPEAAFLQSKNSNNTKLYISKDTKPSKKLTEFKRRVVILLSGYRNREVTMPEMNINSGQRLVLRIEQDASRSRLIAWDLMLDYQFTLEKPFIEERLTEKIMTGPWHLNDDEAVRLHLEENEMIFLAIAASKEANSIPLLKVKSRAGSVKVAGVQKANQLPSNQGYYCKTNSSRKISLEETRGLFKVEYQDKSSTKTETLQLLLIKSKAVIYVRGLEKNNTVELHISQSYDVSHSSNGQFAVTLPVILSSIWVMVCGMLSSICMIMLMNAGRCLMRSEKVLCEEKDDCQPSNNSDVIATATESLFVHHQKYSYGHPVNNFSFHQKNESYEEITERLRAEEQNNNFQRSLKLQIYSETCIMISIALTQISFITAAMLHISEPFCTVNKFAAAFSSNAVYAWILMQCILQFNCSTIMHKLAHYSLIKIVLLNIAYWGLPGLLASILISFSCEQNHRFCWPAIAEDRIIWAEIGFKSGFILLIVVVWIMHLYRSFNNGEDKRTRWQVVRISILLAQFTITWILASLLIAWPLTDYYQYSLMANNLFMGGFILLRVYYQLKENATNTQEQRKSDKEIHDAEAASPAIARHDLYGDDVSIDNGKLSQWEYPSVMS